MRFGTTNRHEAAGKHRTFNIERPTSNEWFEDNHWKFDVGRSMFDVSFNNPPYRSSALQSGVFAGLAG